MSQSLRQKQGCEKLSTLNQGRGQGWEGLAAKRPGGVGDGGDHNPSPASGINSERMPSDARGTVAITLVGWSTVFYVLRVLVGS
jgi:hypothetical protein